MKDSIEKVSDTVEANNAKSIGLIEKLFSVAQPGAVFSEPVTVDDTTVITASETWVGMGYGFGSGTGTGNEDEEQIEVVEEEGVDATFGAGGGGGGFSAGRPIAAISIDADGIVVEPIVDVTKIALAFFTMLGAMLIMLGRMISAADDLG